MIFIQKNSSIYLGRLNFGFDGISLLKSYDILARFCEDQKSDILFLSRSFSSTANHKIYPVIMETILANMASTWAE